ncbi:MAG: hypothetical protein ACKVRP_02455 [Bacteroidota bacterium]
MTGLIVLSVAVVIIFGVIMYSKRDQYKSDDRRRRELEKAAADRYAGLPLIEALDHLYIVTARQLYRDKLKGRDREDLQCDLRLIAELRLSIIEYKIIEEHRDNPVHYFSALRTPQTLSTQ